MAWSKIDHTFTHPELDYNSKPNFQPAIKVSVFFKKLDSINYETFFNHWRTVHADLAVATKAFQTHILRYVQHHQTPEMRERANSLGEGTLEYDACAQLWVRTWNDWLAFYNSPEYAAALKDDCDVFMNLPFTYMVGYENLVVGDTSKDLGGKDECLTRLDFLRNSNPEVAKMAWNRVQVIGIHIRDPRQGKMPILVWLVTGCSQGFGRQFVSSIVARGDRVVATARNIDAIRQLEVPGQVQVLQIDVQDLEAVLEAKIKEAVALFGHLDVLVNNAGYVLSGVWEELSYKDTMQQFETNFFGTMKLTRAILPHFRSRKSGSLVFMSSISGWLGAAAGGPYSATKFALEGAVECLDKEVSSFGVSTHVIVLGQFQTNILNSTNRATARSNRVTEYDSVIDSLSKRHEMTHGLQPGDPEKAVERILDLVRREGVMAGIKDMPMRMPLGSDAVEIVRSECLKTLSEVSKFEAFSCSTDFGKKAVVPVYQ